MEQRGFFPKKCFENWWNTAGGSTKWRSAGWSRLLKQDAGKVWNGRLPSEFFSVKQFSAFRKRFSEIYWRTVFVGGNSSPPPSTVLWGVQCWCLFFEILLSLANGLIVKDDGTHGTSAVQPGPANTKKKAPSVWNDTEKTKMGRHEFPFWTAKPALYAVRLWPT